MYSFKRVYTLAFFHSTVSFGSKIRKSGGFLTRASALLLCLGLVSLGRMVGAQTGNSSSVNGTILDPTGAAVANAKVEIHNPVSEFERSTTTDSTGKFSFANVPFNPYHLSVNAQGFAPFTQDVEIRSVVPVSLNLSLKLGESSTNITVSAEAQDLIENDSTSHTDVDRNLFDKIPLESASSGLSSLVTLASPGISADSNGLFHGLGDHAENSFSVDGQPITDQQSKVFSNQIPLDSVQSLEVISGAPPAEFGDKTSVVIKVTTRSGQGILHPTGNLTTSYGSFGTENVAFNLAYGGQNWGNFISVSGLNSGRFLDPPEFAVMHDKGNEENIFDRIDFQLSNNDAIHLNLGYTRSWFQTPNSFDNLNLNSSDPLGNPVAPADQRSKINTFNIAPTWTRLLSSRAVFTLGGFVRRDSYNYYPSGNPFSDLNSTQQETISQNRTLTNAGIRSDLSYVKGIHNIKVGATYQQTFLDEKFNLGIVDPTVNPVCLDSGGNPITDPTVLDPNCTGAGQQQNPAFSADLFPYDLWRGGSLYHFIGHTDIKQLALFVQDTITKGNWSFNLGVRGDLYNGITTQSQAQPRLGVAYNIKQTNTVLRVSYGRMLETPFNENLVLSSSGCANVVLNQLLGCNAGASGVLGPGWRNEFHAGLEQAFGKHFVVSGDYIWKYTHNGYDFSVLGSTPITFPISWHNSKIPGYAVRASVPSVHGFTALVVFSSVAARFFPPQIGGAGATVGQTGAPFRIDHDEKFNLTGHLQYQPWLRGPWFGFNWRYDSGLVAGSVPCYGVNPENNCGASTTLGGLPAIDLTGFTADQEFQAGFFCGSIKATPTTVLPSPCLASQFGSNLVKVPAPNTQNDDHNPPRIAPRNLFDVAVGHDNIFRGDKYKWSARLEAINVTNKYALYNFLSTFSGTHYVTPRSLTAEVGFHF